MNSNRLTINDPRQIPALVDLIHDCWFDAADIVFDEEDRIVSIKFTREAMDKSRLLSKSLFLKKWEIPSIECFLKIYHVNVCSIKDTTQVGHYNFIDLDYDPQLKRLTINTGVPININLTVNSFEVAIEETNKVIETRVLSSLFNLKLRSER
jgi:hypothetical protein